MSGDPRDLTADFCRFVEGDIGATENARARLALSLISRLALFDYPYSDDAPRCDGRYILVLGMIAGLADDALKDGPS